MRFHSCMVLASFAFFHSNAVAAGEQQRLDVTPIRFADPPQDGLNGHRKSAPTHLGTSHFYAIIYSYQGQGLRAQGRAGALNLPRRTHTWGVFLRSEGAALPYAPAEAFTISWLPADKRINVFSGKEPGMNFSHAATMSLARERGLITARSRVYEISKPLYEALAARYRKLERAGRDGSISYDLLALPQSRMRAIGNRTGAALNCVSAIADAIPEVSGAPLLRTGTARGIDLGNLLVEYFSANFKGTSAELEEAYRLRLN